MKRTPFDEVPPVRPWRIEKTTFSRKPWRLVDAHGRWIALGVVPLTLPGGPPTEPIVGADTKRECIELVCGFAADLYDLWLKERAF